MVEVGRQSGRLLAAGQRGGQARCLGADALVERLVIAEAGQPGQAQAGGGELAQRPLQQAGMMREAEFAPEEVRSVGPRSVGSPEDLTRPVERLHPLVVRPAGIRRHHPAFEQGEERLQLVPLRVVDRVPVVTASCSGSPVAGPRTAPSVRMVASTACTVSASWGRCTGTISAYLGSAKRALRNSNRAGDWTSASCRSVMWTRHASGRPEPRASASSGPAAPKSSRTRCGSPAPISMAR